MRTDAQVPSFIEADALQFIDIYRIRRTLAAAFAAGSALAVAGASQAQELRVGAGYAPHEPEQGTSVVVDYLFKPPKLLKFAGSPRPYLGAQFSLDGFTNFAQTGLIWRMERGRAYLDLGAGLAVHDGDLSLPPPMVGLPLEENIRRRRDRDTRIEYETRIQYHATFALGWRVSPRWAVELEGQHWSNGHLGSDIHDGADSLGLRGAYRF